MQFPCPHNLKKQVSFMLSTLSKPMNTIKNIPDFSVNILLTLVEYAPDSPYFLGNTEQHNQKVHICEDTVSIS